MLQKVRETTLPPETQYELFGAKLRAVKAASVPKRNIPAEITI